MKKIFILICLVLSGYVVSAQDYLIKFSQYDILQPVINPAMAGGQEGTNGLLLYRTRFESADFAPNTGVFNINSAFPEKRIGAGFTILYDRFGPYQKMNAYLQGSYRMPVSNDASLLFGLQAGINYVSNIDNYKKADEEVIYNGSYNQPNFGFGIHYQAPKYYLGFSIPEIMSNYINSNGEKVSDMLSGGMRFYLYGGSRFTLTENLNLEPSLYFIYSDVDKLELDLGANFIFRESISAGFRYKLDESFMVQARVKIMNDVWLGYSFENGSSSISNRFNNMQEISLTFRFGKKSKSAANEKETTDEQINSIRYF